MDFLFRDKGNDLSQDAVAVVEGVCVEGGLFLRDFRHRGKAGREGRQDFAFRCPGKKFLIESGDIAVVRCRSPPSVHYR